MIRAVAGSSCDCTPLEATIWIGGSAPGASPDAVAAEVVTSTSTPGVERQRTAGAR